MITFKNSTASLTWVETPTHIPCLRARGPYSKILCERELDHGVTPTGINHVGRGVVGQYFFWSDQ